MTSRHGRKSQECNPSGPQQRAPCLCAQTALKTAVGPPGVMTSWRSCGEALRFRSRAGLPATRGAALSQPAVSWGAAGDAASRPDTSQGRQVSTEARTAPRFREGERGGTIRTNGSHADAPGTHKGRNQGMSSCYNQGSIFTFRTSSEVKFVSPRNPRPDCSSGPQTQGSSARVNWGRPQILTVKSV